MNIKKGKQKNRLQQLLVIVFLFNQIPFIYAQIDTSAIKHLTNGLQTVTNNRASENVYLQTSKGIYETSEDLWFKGYVLNSQYLTPSSQSKTLYVQLIEDATKKAVWEEKYEIENGFVDGHIYVQDTLKAGSYTLAGYTPHSLYKDKHPIESIRKVRIVESITKHLKGQKKDTLAKPKKEAIDFQLFPEGGHLVTGIQSKLAFKAVDTKGNPKTVSGTVFENNKPIQQFKSLHVGMGYFMLFPQIGSHYHIVLDSVASQKQYTLPSIKPTGAVMQLVRNTSGFLTLKISKTNSLEQDLYIRIQQRGIVYGIASIKVKNQQYVKMPLENIPQGIAEVTLFDQNLQPLAERLVYVNQDEKLHIKTTLDKEDYLTKDNVKLKIKVTDQNNTPVVAHLGLSVFDKVYLNPKDTKTIETHYHLSTQLKGKLYNPSYYFNKKNKNRKPALDLLLLTQGWRAYTWNEHNIKVDPLKKKPYINDTIVGKLYAKHPKYKPLIPQQYLVAFTADDTKGKVFIEVDSLGRYIILPEYMGLASRSYLYIKLLGGDEINKKINNTAIDDPSFGAISQLQKQKVFNYPIFKKVRVQQLYDKRAFTLTDDVNKLEEITIKGKKKRVFRDKYMGRLDSLAKLLQTQDYVCHENIHKEGLGGAYKTYLTKYRTSGVLNCPYHPTSFGLTRPIAGETYTVIYDKNYKILKEYSDESDAADFGPAKYFFKTPTLTESELLRKFNLATIKGYYGEKKFYSPVYDKVEQHGNFPDYRNTLFWKPDIITDENGEATVEFYCSNINTKFKGLVEGVSGNGKLGRETFEFDIKKR